MPTILTRAESIALLDPELIAYVDRPSDDLSAVPLPIARENANAAFMAMAGPSKRAPEVLHVKGLKDQPPVEVRVHSPENSKPTKAVLHVHGGGMVKGSAFALDSRMCNLSDFLDAIIVSVEYRLAPETPFPGPLYDCVAAWNWMIEEVRKWGLLASACLISGDSAGGGLAAATTLFLRDTGGQMPVGQVLVFPMLDFQTGEDEHSHLDTRLGWNSINNQFGWRALLGDQPLPTGASLGHYSPSHAKNMNDLPPTWIGVGTLDLFLAENTAFVARLASAGCQVTLCVYKGAPHGFQVFPSRVSSRFFGDYKAAFDSMIR